MSLVYHKPARPVLTSTACSMAAPAQEVLWWADVAEELVQHLSSGIRETRRSAERLPILRRPQPAFAEN
jgi:hypothetical protein